MLPTLFDTQNGVSRETRVKVPDSAVRTAEAEYRAITDYAVKPRSAVEQGLSVDELSVEILPLAPGSARCCVCQSGFGSGPSEAAAREREA